MSRQPSMNPVNAVVADAPPVVPTAASAAVSLQLGGDEIIQLSIRPSPWYIAVRSFKLVVAFVLLAAAVLIAVQGQPALPGSIVLVVIVLLGFSGILEATLHWSSQLYVLTNRRVVRFHGVFNVDVAQCGLTQINEVKLHPAWYHPFLRLGSLRFSSNNQAHPGLVWEHVARPAEVHEILVRAIQRAKSGQ